MWNDTQESGQNPIHSSLLANLVTFHTWRGWPLAKCLNAFLALENIIFASDQLDLSFTKSLSQSQSWALVFHSILFFSIL